MTRPTRNSDDFAIKAVVVTLAILSVGGFLSIAYLAIIDAPIPDQLDRLVAGSLAALVGILAATRTGPTEVVAPVGQPVAVEEVDPPKK